MFAKYVTTSSPTQANVIADIAALLAGAAITDLSSSCDKSNSTLLSTVAPGWTITDNNAGSSGYILSAPDLAGNTKYVKLFASNATYLDIQAYETWNSTSHTGTNPTTALGAVSTSPGVTVNVVNYFFIFATARSFIVMGGGSNPAGGGGIGAFEFTREAAYLQGTTYPAVCVGMLAGLTNSNKNMNISRTKNLTAAGDTVPTTALSATIAARNVAAGGITSPTSYLIDANGTYYNEIRPIWLATSGAGAAIYGKCIDVFETTNLSAVGNPLDTLSDGTGTYMILVQTTGVGTLIAKVA
jgi:hypothetical protein